MAGVERMSGEAPEVRSLLWLLYPPHCDDCGESADRVQLDLVVDKADPQFVLSLLCGRCQEARFERYLAALPAEVAAKYLDISPT